SPIENSLLRLDLVPDFISLLYYYESQMIWFYQPAEIWIYSGTTSLNYPSP
ncbi:unnamed protein product, partial [Arabidopsis halleri]